MQNFNPFQQQPMQQQPMQPQQVIPQNGQPMQMPQGGWPQQFQQQPPQQQGFQNGGQQPQFIQGQGQQWQGGQQMQGPQGNMQIPMGAGGMPGVGMQMPPPMQGPPTMPTVDAALVQEAYARAAAEQAALSKGDGTVKFFDLKPPPPSKNWKTAPRGASAYVVGFLCPNLRQGAPPFADDVTHFWKSQSAPNGTACRCLGMAQGALPCPVCLAKLMFERNGGVLDPNSFSAKRPRRQVIYQLLPRDAPQDMMCTDGLLRPMLIRVPADASVMLGEKFNLKGLHTFFNPQHARPVVFIKKKVRDDEMGVETTVDDLDAVDIPSVYWNAMANLHDLNSPKVLRPTTADHYQKAVLEMGLPMTQEVQQVIAAIKQQEQAAQQAQNQQQAANAGQYMGQQGNFQQGQNGQQQFVPLQNQPQASYNPNPNPPNPNPYPQQQQGFQNGGQQQFQQQPMQQQQWQPPQQNQNVPGNVPQQFANTMMGR